MATRIIGKRKALEIGRFVLVVMELAEQLANDAETEHEQPSLPSVRDSDSEAA